MNPNWRAKWQQLEEKANALSVRERLIVAVATGVLLLGVFDQLLLRPWRQSSLSPLRLCRADSSST